MDVREKLTHILTSDPEMLKNLNVSTIKLYRLVDKLIAHGVTVQECKVVEIDQFKFPIDDAILILTEELNQMSDGYTTHLAYGGKGDPAMEANLNALELAISALESQKRMMPQPPKGE